MAQLLGPVDRHLIGEGRHRRLWDVLGSEPRTVDGVEGAAFAVWAPNARAVRVVGDWNKWAGRVPGVQVGTRYKYEIIGADGSLRLRADPMARRAEMPPSTASIVDESS